jgi:hypothetical protein
MLTCKESSTIKARISIGGKRRAGKAKVRPNVITDDEERVDHNDETESWESDEEPKSTQIPKKSQVNSKSVCHEGFHLTLFFYFRRRESSHKSRRRVHDLLNLKVCSNAYTNLIVISNMLFK